MNKLVSAALAAAALTTTACAGVPFAGRPAVGTMPTLYANTSSSEWFTDNSRTGGKAGEACATSILGLVTTGNASASEAARKAGITRITFTENTFENIVGVYSKYCLIVHGD